MPMAGIPQSPLLEEVIGPSVAVVSMSAAFGESRLDETDFPAQHVGGFPAEFWLFSHQIEKSLSIHVQHFSVGNCHSGQAVGMSRKSGGDPQKRTGRKDSIQLCQVLDRQTDLAFQHQVNPLVFLIHLKQIDRKSTRLN